MKLRVRKDISTDERQLVLELLAALVAETNEPERKAPQPEDGPGRPRLVRAA